MNYGLSFLIPAKLASVPFPKNLGMDPVRATCQVFY